MKHIWLAGIAAIAFSASPALAQGKGGGHGGGNGGGGGKDHGSAMQAANPGHGNGGGGPAMQQASNDGGKGNGHGQGKGGSAMQSSSPDRDHGNSAGRAAAAPKHGNDGGTEHGKGSGMAGANDKSDRGKGHPNAKAEHVPAQHGAQIDHANGMAKANPGRGKDGGVVAEGHGKVRTRSADDDARLRQVFAQRSHGLIDGCPPGLAAKNNGCRPPGQVRQEQAAWQNTLYRPDWWGLQGFSGNNYAYDNGYLYQLGNDGGIARYMPLLGGALGIGNGWPSYYQPVQLPDYYQSYYGLGPVDTYRYANNVIYRVDPTSSAISSIAALLTGDSFNVGQPLPLGYDAYNVPYPYRSQYADTPDDWYRYSDGYVYQVDPKTRLVTAAIELLGAVL